MCLQMPSLRLQTPSHPTPHTPRHPPHTLKHPQNLRVNRLASISLSCSASTAPSRPQPLQPTSGASTAPSRPQPLQPRPADLDPSHHTPVDAEDQRLASRRTDSEVTVSPTEPPFSILEPATQAISSHPATGSWSEASLEAPPKTARASSSHRGGDHQPDSLCRVSGDVFAPERMSFCLGRHGLVYDPLTAQACVLAARMWQEYRRRGARDSE